MQRRTTPLRSALTNIWRAERLLTGVGLLMLGLLAGALIGVWLDPRLVGGAPVWLKPAKFAASIAIYVFTLAWIFTLLSDWPRTRRVVGRTTAVVLILEFAIIALQAGRGVSSHFNTATPFDGVLFGVMGLAIVLQTVTSIAVAVALWRQPFADRALGAALRLGMTFTIVGAFTGGLMTTPTAAQLAAARAGGMMPISGAHTVGAVDGGPGIPGTGWSREHGDLRVAHFVGLHAVQALTLIVLLGGRRANDVARLRLAHVAAGSYALLFVLLLSQALRGQSIVTPDGVMTSLFLIWGVASVVAAWLALSGARTMRSRPVAI